MTKITWMRLPAWFCIALLAILSLLPADEMVRTGVGGHAEHAAAYAGTAVFVRLAYPNQAAFRQALGLVAYAATLEYLQNYSPGRTPAVGDWFFSSLGAVIGSTVGNWVLPVWSRVMSGFARSRRNRT